VNRGRSLGDGEVVDVYVMKSILCPSMPVVMLSSTVALTFSLYSFIPDHLGAAIAIVEIMTESYHAACADIVGADPP
jgi:hypothetical protein